MSKHIVQMNQAQFDELGREFYQATKYLAYSKDYAYRMAAALPDITAGEIMTVLVNWQGETYSPSLEDFLERTGQHVAVGVSPKTVVRKESYWRYDSLPLTKKPFLVLMRNGEHRVVRPGLALSISDTKAWMPIPKE